MEFFMKVATEDEWREAGPIPLQASNKNYVGEKYQ